MDDHGLAELIPGLPNDVSLGILARVPRRYHATTMARVSSSWSEMVRSQSLFAERKRLHSTEPWLYTAVVCEQDENGPCVSWFARSAFCNMGTAEHSSDWCPLPLMPEEHRPVYGFRSAVIGDLLFVVGGCEWRASQICPAMNKVSVFNARTNGWTSAPDMISARANFACGVVNGILFVAGGNRLIDMNPESISWIDMADDEGSDINLNCLRSAEAYNPKTNTWMALSEMIQAKHFVSGCVIGNKFAVCGFRCEEGLQFSEITEVFEAEENRWVEVDLQNMQWGGHETAFLPENNHFQVEPTEGMLLKYDSGFQNWKTLSSANPMTSCLQLALYGSNLFVLGDSLDLVQIGIERESGEASRTRALIRDSQRPGIPQACQIIAI
eukprot:Gb_06552 [translate_table: standard]